MGIDEVNKAVCSVFNPHGFVINWKPGKTEECVKHLGNQAAMRLSQRWKDGRLAVNLPSSAGARHVNVVHEYNYLGSVAANCTTHYLPLAIAAMLQLGRMRFWRSSFLVRNISVSGFV